MKTEVKIKIGLVSGIDWELPDAKGTGREYRPRKATKEKIDGNNE
jgi:hypothetical protein